MNIYLSLARFGLPGFYKKKKMTELFELTSRAFQCDRPELKGFSYRELLIKYASCTAAWAEKCVDAPDAVKARLFKEAHDMGQDLRKQFRITSFAEALEMSRIIYRLLGIDYSGRSDGQVIIASCFFSQYYSAPVCRIIAGLDEGLSAGLTGGERLVFSQRMTEGLPVCRAQFSGRDGQ
jgi:hypothetical protein